MCPGVNKGFSLRIDLKYHVLFLFGLKTIQSKDILIIKNHVLEKLSFYYKGAFPENRPENSRFVLFLTKKQLIKHAVPSIKNRYVL